MNFEQWAPKEREQTENENKVCRPTSVEEVTELVNSHKDERAPGVDGLKSNMLKIQVKNTNRNLLTWLRKC